MGRGIRWRCGERRDRGSKGEQREGEAALERGRRQMGHEWSVKMKPSPYAGRPRLGCRRVPTARVSGSPDPPNVIVVELAPLDQLEAVAQVKAIGCAVSQCPNAHRQDRGIRFGEYQRENGGTDPTALRAGPDVEMIEQQSAIAGPDHHEAHALVAGPDVAGVCRSEAGHEAQPQRD